MYIDNKHGLKVGEPGFPMAATERGRRILVRAGTTFEVDNHYFNKFSIIPFVLLVTDIPDSLTYRLSLYSKNSMYHHIPGTFRWNRLCQLPICDYSACRVNVGKGDSHFEAEVARYIYCADAVQSAPKDKHPQCSACKSKPKILKT